MICGGIRFVQETAQRSDCARWDIVLGVVEVILIRLQACAIYHECLKASHAGRLLVLQSLDLSDYSSCDLEIEIGPTDEVARNCTLAFDNLVEIAK
jgi:hypothetical protein